MVQSPSRGGAVLCVSHSPDGSLLASAGQNGTIQVKNICTEEISSTHKLSSSEALSTTSISPQPTSRCRNSHNWNTPQVLDTHSGENVHELASGEAQAVGSVCFSPRGGLLAAAERCTGKIRLWGLQSGVEVRIWRRCTHYRFTHC
jgi:WD40 repeat protein